MIAGSPLFRFLVVGAVGFGVDGSTMLALVNHAGFGPIAARTVSFPIAVAVTWFLNRVWTFAAGRERRPLEQLRAYALTQVGGLSINYLVFAVLTRLGGFWSDWLIVSLAVGAALSMAFTFLVSQRLVFSHRLAGAKGPPA